LPELQLLGWVGWARLRHELLGDSALDDKISLARRGDLDDAVAKALWDQGRESIRAARLSALSDAAAARALLSDGRVGLVLAMLEENGSSWGKVTVRVMCQLVVAKHSVRVATKLVEAHVAIGAGDAPGIAELLVSKPELMNWLGGRISGKELNSAVLEVCELGALNLGAVGTMIERCGGVSVDCQARIVAEFGQQRDDYHLERAVAALGSAKWVAPQIKQTLRQCFGQVPFGSKAELSARLADEVAVFERQVGNGDFDAGGGLGSIQQLMGMTKLGERGCGRVRQRLGVAAAKVGAWGVLQDIAYDQSPAQVRELFLAVGDVGTAVQMLHYEDGVAAVMAKHPLCEQIVAALVADADDYYGSRSLGVVLSEPGLGQRLIGNIPVKVVQARRGAMNAVVAYGVDRLGQRGAAFSVYADLVTSGVAMTFAEAVEVALLTTG
jgi:hypothetical protein